MSGEVGGQAEKDRDEGELKGSSKFKRAEEEFSNTLLLSDEQVGRLIADLKGRLREEFSIPALEAEHAVRVQSGNLSPEQKKLFLWDIMREWYLSCVSSVALSHFLLLYSRVVLCLIGRDAGRGKTSPSLGKIVNSTHSALLESLLHASSSDNCQKLREKIRKIGILEAKKFDPSSLVKGSDVRDELLLWSPEISEACLEVWVPYLTSREHIDLLMQAIRREGGSEGQPRGKEIASEVLLRRADEISDVLDSDFFASSLIEALEGGLLLLWSRTVGSSFSVGEFRLARSTSLMKAEAAGGLFGGDVGKEKEDPYVAFYARSTSLACESLIEQGMEGMQEGSAPRLGLTLCESLYWRPRLKDSWQGVEEAVEDAVPDSTTPLEDAGIQELF